MIFKIVKFIANIFTIVKALLFISFIILILGYPLVVHDMNPFIFYHEIFTKIIEGIKQIRNYTH